MRIHLQNPPNDPLFQFSRSMWDEAAARAPDSAAGVTVTIGHTKEDFATAMRDAEALVTDTGVVKANFPHPAPALKLLFVTSAGLDKLAPYDWLPSTVTLMNNRGTHDAKSGEFGLMAVLMLASRIPEMVTNQRAGHWKPIWGSVIARRRVTIIGLGTLGGATARNLAALGVEITGVRARPAPHPHCTRVVGVDQLDEVLAATEFLVIACPLTNETRNLIDRRRLGLLPPKAGIVNIGRGEIVDQDALCDALDSGRIGGAVLDVFTPEPIPDGHRLWNTPNLVISPHTSADDPATYNPRSLDIFLENLRAWRAGRPLPNHFDIVRGY